MNLTQNYFELFDLPEGWEIDTALLAAQYRRLQQETHPDRFAAASDRERLQAVQQASRVNDAYDTLKSPLKRGIYLLGLRDIAVEMENNTLMDTAFLMQQMMLREELEAVDDAADPEAALEQLRAHIDQLQQAYADAFAAAWAGQDPEALQAAADTLRKMQFLVRLDEEAERLEARLLDEF